MFCAGFLGRKWKKKINNITDLCHLLVVTEVVVIIVDVVDDVEAEIPTPNNFFIHNL